MKKFITIQMNHCLLLVPISKRYLSVGLLGKVKEQMKKRDLKRTRRISEDNMSTLFSSYIDANVLQPFSTDINDDDRKDDEVDTDG